MQTSVRHRQSRKVTLSFPSPFTSEVGAVIFTGEVLSWYPKAKAKEREASKRTSQASQNPQLFSIRSDYFVLQSYFALNVYFLSHLCIKPCRLVFLPCTLLKEVSFICHINTFVGFSLSNLSFDMGMSREGPLKWYSSLNLKTTFVEIKLFLNFLPCSLR